MDWYAACDFLVFPDHTYLFLSVVFFNICIHLGMESKVILLLLINCFMYKGCSNLNAASIITLLTYIMRPNVIRF